MDKVKELAKKLKALADRGEGGERLTAENMLQKLLKKHDISIAEIEGESTEIEMISISKKYEFISHIIIQSVVGECPFYSFTNKDTGKNLSSKTGVKCTKAEFIEIQAKLDFYYKVFETELHYFEIAFLHKNNIEPKTFNPENDDRRKQLSYEESQKIRLISGGIDEHPFLKQIGE
jgi:hypothetical protein